jgi:ubiquinone/menaquinone biosynthesis C-methylase UbiE
MSAAFGMTHSAAAAAFDRVAASYDELFTHTATGRAQRKQVWGRLLAAFPPGNRVLELNCGTGEDARFLAKLGRSVVACDASLGMIQVAEQRTKVDGEFANLEFRHIANEQLRVLAGAKPFDGAFSNFSGLNCAVDVAQVVRALANLIRPGGYALVCVWSRLSVVELLWYLLHGQPAKAVRRFFPVSMATLGGNTIPVFYPGVRELCRSFAPYFRLSSRRAVGLFVPPSYMEPWIAKHPRLLKHLERLDEICSAWPVFRSAGDHVLLEFVRCQA